MRMMIETAFKGRQTLVILTVALAISTMPAWAQAQDMPRLHTNQTYLEEVRRTSELVLTDPLAAFAFVLGSLPARVMVYPTENFYYYYFIHNGRPMHGNIRLDPRDRDQGKVDFGYYQGLSQWKDEGGIESFVVLDASHGVKVERVDRLVYRVSYKDTSVVFELNDLSTVRPPPAAVGPDEKFLGPIFDESGIRFFLVYNTKLKAFHYILDETAAVDDEFFAAKRSDRIVIGRRTGFAFYRDDRIDRKIMIGAFEGNVNTNSWFDGPFDQLPENFIEGEELREAIIAADPEVEGQIDRLGHYLKEDGRYVISPYIVYKSEGDLMRIHECANARKKRPDYHRCFVVDYGGRIDPPLPRPFPKKR